MRHRLYDVRRNVPMWFVGFKERPGDINLAARACRDPLLVIEEVVGVFVVHHHRLAPVSATIAGRGHRDPARCAVRETEVVHQCGIIEGAVRSKCQRRIAPSLHMLE